MTAAFIPTLDDPPIQELAREGAVRAHLRGADFGAGPGVDLRAYGWKVLVCCLLLARTNRAAVTRQAELEVEPAPDPAAAGELWQRFLLHWPGPGNVLGPPRAAVLEQMERQLRPLGFQRRRARLMVELAAAWQRDSDRILARDLDVQELPGCGQYAADAFDLFVRGDLTVRPGDGVLASWQRTRINTNGKEPEMATATPTKPARKTTGAKKSPAAGGRRKAAAKPAAPDLLGELNDLTRRVKERGHTREMVERAREIAGELGQPVPTWAAEPARAARKSGENGGTEKRPRASAAGRKVPKYPDEVRDSVRRAKQIRGTDKGAPGCKQHVMVRTAIGDRDPLEVVGLSERALRDLASGKAATEKLRAAEKFQALAGSFEDSFCKGRNLASILAAIVEQRKEA